MTFDLDICSDVNKATFHEAKARELKAKDFQHSPRQQPSYCYRTRQNIFIYFTKKAAINSKEK